ncbi:rho-related GTP-binding protein RhoH [Entelurus aequoreus]|uniref:rho-related GTP-binding protein RhoH n=1 Tax=Entelurus aequoreus TaxID=161455 RepID=UPI002B1D6536|nr:rho-related GTP-binding protein RhoH [Entelurus aequoreus]
MSRAPPAAGASVKCVLVGDSAVGKTALLVRFASGAFPDAYRPTVFDNTGLEFHMDGALVQLGLWDTAGHDNFKAIRPRSYQQADVVLVCFSVANPTSLASVCTKWMAEVRQHLPDVPVLMVANQTDLRESGARRGGCISAAEGKRVAHSLRAKGYLECSSLSNRGVAEVFQCAVRTAISHGRKQARRRMFSINKCKVF